MAAGDDAVFYRRQASYFSRHNQLDKAIEAYTKAIELDPGATVVYLDRAGAEMRNGDSTAALADLDIVGKSENKNLASMGFSLKVTLLTSGENLKEALSTCDTWVKSCPEEFEARISRADLLEKMDQKSKAVPDLEAAVKLLGESLEKSQDANLFSMRGKLYERLGMIESAQKDWRAALKLYLSQRGIVPLRTMRELSKKVGDPDLIQAVNERAQSFGL